MKKLILGVIIFVTLFNCVLCLVSLSSFSSYILYINSNSYLPDSKPKYKLNSNQIDALANSFNLDIEVNYDTHSVVVNQKEIDLAIDDIKLGSINKDLIEERDLRNIWLTRERNNIVTYMFKDSEEFGAYTIMKFVTSEDKTKEIIYTGTYDIDTDNKVTLSFIRKLSDDNELEVISKKEYWYASRNDLFLTLKQDDREMQMRLKE